MTIAFEVTLIIVMLACVLFLFGDQQHRFRIEYAIIFTAAAAAMLALLRVPLPL